MLVDTLSQYLESHKRLVVPQLGAFIVKEPGRIVLFSELMKRDDGVLRGALCAAGQSEMEAAGEINRFVFEVRHAVEHDEEFLMEGFGVLKAGVNGTIAFVYQPRPVERSASSEPHVESGAPRMPQCDPARIAATMKCAFDEPRVSSSAKMNPDPSVRGLRYGRPHKNTDAYTFVDKPPRRRTDRFVWIAAVAIAIALAVIAYGYFREARDKRIEAEPIPPTRIEAEPIPPTQVVDTQMPQTDTVQTPSQS